MPLTTPTSCSAATRRTTPALQDRPCVVVEVLSLSTANIDRREKRLAYGRLTSLQAYLLVDPERRQTHNHLRGADGGWRAGRLQEGEVLNLRCGGLELALSLNDLCEDVPLPPE